jgi:tRNA nucleotidyltransferase/poly(A) polymerase
MRHVGSERDVNGTDEDIATSATPEQVQALFASRPGFAVASNNGESHGTQLVLLDGKPFEVSTFRRDVACDGRHAKVVWTNDLVTDLSRRDFTCNAIAYDPIDDQVIDPFKGLADLRRKLVRAVGDPCRRLQEDWLRLLRAPRMAMDIGGQVESGLERAIRQNAGELSQVSAERRRDELLKMLGYADGWHAPVTLAELDLLRSLLPSLDSQRGHGLRSEHPLDLDLFERGVMRACGARLAGSDQGQASLRLMAYYAEMTPTSTASDLRGLCCTNRLVDSVLRIAAFYRDIPPDGSWHARSAPRYQREFLLRVARHTPEAKMAAVVEQLIALRLAEGGFNPAPLRKAAREPLYRGQLQVDGNDILALGIPPGPSVGRALASLLRVGPGANRSSQLAQLSVLVEEARNASNST